MVLGLGDRSRGHPCGCTRTSSPHGRCCSVPALCLEGDPGESPVGPPSELAERGQDGRVPSRGGAARRGPRELPGLSTHLRRGWDFTRPGRGEKGAPSRVRSVQSPREPGGLRAGGISPWDTVEMSEPGGPDPAALRQAGSSSACRGGRAAVPRACTWPGGEGQGHLRAGPSGGGPGLSSHLPSSEAAPASLPWPRLRPSSPWARIPFSRPHSCPSLLQTWHGCPLPPSVGLGWELPEPPRALL